MSAPLPNFQQPCSTDHEEMANMKIEFIALWDGFSTDARVMVLAATNRPSELDEAILRRLPQAFEIGMPDRKERAEILKVTLKGERVEPDTYYDHLARLCEGYSGSDIFELCKKAAYFPIREIREEDIPLPKWVVEEVDKDPDLAYTDQWGRRNHKYISLGADTLPVLKGRTPMQCFSDVMWSGAFQCYDKYSLSSLKAAAEAYGKPEWGSTGPTDAGHDNNWPEDAQFFKKEDGAKSIFENTDVKLSAKIAGIHWHYGTPSHAPEVTTGYYNTRFREGYLPIAQMLARHNAVFNFTCIEMRDHEQPQDALCAPEQLVNQILKASALSFDQNSEGESRQMCTFTYMRMNPELFKAENRGKFEGFVKKMGEGRDSQRCWEEVEGEAEHFVHVTQPLVQEAAVALSLTKGREIVAWFNGNVFPRPSTSNLKLVKWVYKVMEKKDQRTKQPMFRRICPKAQCLITDATSSEFGGFSYQLAQSIIQKRAYRKKTEEKHKLEEDIGDSENPRPSTSNLKLVKWVYKVMEKKDQRTKQPMFRRICPKAQCLITDATSSEFGGFSYQLAQSIIQKRAYRKKTEEKHKLEEDIGDSENVRIPNYLVEGKAPPL
ncbi:hypothetical protein Bca52824_017769 [Brassica carinata]|uniref:Beta-amylase n=1 Tax=Brassica carinata TaxID=52824 RepID=A0A8X8AXQ8_BRACI|nr:hypothetical protein Bca52824_017769 [Brassica carinata]